MSKSSNRHVVPSKSGSGWDVKAPGASRASAHTRTQGEAVKRANQIVDNAGGGEVRIHRPNGQIRNSNTVGGGNDPFPPRDTK
jgi:hypothetical protein